MLHDGECQEVDNFVRHLEGKKHAPIVVEMSPLGDDFNLMNRVVHGLRYFELSAVVIMGRTDRFLERMKNMILNFYKLRGPMLWKKIGEKGSQPSSF